MCLQMQPIMCYTTKAQIGNNTQEMMLLDQIFYQPLLCLINGLDPPLFENHLQIVALNLGLFSASQGIAQCPSGGREKANLIH